MAGTEGEDAGGDHVGVVVENDFFSEGLVVEEDADGGEISGHGEGHFEVECAGLGNGDFEGEAVGGFGAGPEELGVPGPAVFAEVFHVLD